MAALAPPVLLVCQHLQVPPALRSPLVLPALPRLPVLLVPLRLPALRSPLVPDSRFDSRIYIEATIVVILAPAGFRSVSC